MSDPLLSPRDLALVDAIAERVLELLAERSAPRARSPRRVTAGQLAELLGVGREWVYQHADELGAVRLPATGNRERKTDPRPRLRFDVDRALAAWNACQASSESQPADRPAAADDSHGRRRRAAASEAEALPSGAPSLRIGPKRQAAS